MVAAKPAQNESSGGVSAGSRGSNAETGTQSFPVAAARTHMVKSGETPAAIARKYGVRLDALMAANPKVDARRMQIGQSLTIPAP